MGIQARFDHSRSRRQDGGSSRGARKQIACDSDPRSESRSPVAGDERCAQLGSDLVGGRSVDPNVEGR